MIDQLFEFAQVFINQALTIPVDNIFSKIYIILNNLLLLMGLITTPV